MKAIVLTVLVLAVLLYCRARNHQPAGSFWYEERTVEAEGETRTLLRFGSDQ